MNRRPYPNESPYYRQPPYPSQEHYYGPNGQQWHQQLHNYNSTNYQSHPTPFDQYVKPIQPVDWPYPTYQNSTMHDSTMYEQLNNSPNSSQSMTGPPPSFFNQFQTSDGQVDLNKMLSTVGQLANTVQQISPMIKEFGTMMKGFR